MDTDDDKANRLSNLFYRSSTSKRSQEFSPKVGLAVLDLAALDRSQLGDDVLGLAKVDFR